MVVLGILGWLEYARLSAAGGFPFGTSILSLGSLSICLFGLVALRDLSSLDLLAALTFAAFAPAIASLGRRGDVGPFGILQSATFGGLYLGIPVFSAIVLRGVPGQVSQIWFTEFASNIARLGAAAPLGLALVLTIIITVWLSDTVAYLAGSAVGRRKLAPHISPGKTIEGSAAGLAAAIISGAVTVTCFGAGSWERGVILGAVAGVAGQLGDLTESLMKRQVGVKDSGALIPGHGGILDRIDALLFAFPAALLTVYALNWFER